MSAKHGVQYGLTAGFRYFVERLHLPLSPFTPSGAVLVAARAQFISEWVLNGTLADQSSFDVRRPLTRLTVVLPVGWWVGGKRKPRTLYFLRVNVDEAGVLGDGLANIINSFQVIHGYLLYKIDKPHRNGNLYQRADPTPSERMMNANHCLSIDLLEVSPKLGLPRDEDPLLFETVYINGPSSTCLLLGLASSLVTRYSDTITTSPPSMS